MTCLHWYIFVILMHFINFQEEKHLLPPPYQTNCTDYMSVWFERGGIGHLDPVVSFMIICQPFQEKFYFLESV